jgi:hypothetical protein
MDPDEGKRDTMIDLGLTTDLDVLRVAWKGSDIDELLWYSSTADGSNWAAPAVIPGAGSSVGPALDVFNGMEYAAWKGSDGDPQLYYSSSGTSGWAPQQFIPGAASDVGPSLAKYNGLLYAAWRGANGDPQLFYSSFDGSGWAAQQVIPGVGSSVGPSLAGFDRDGLLYAAWRGADGDTNLYYSSFDGSGWAAQQPIPGGSDVGPCLRVINGLLYAAWVGADGDPRLFYSSFDGSGWAAQQVIPGVGSSIGPSLGVFNGLLYAAWRGADTDQQVYYSSFDGSGWAPQQVIPGAGSGPVPAPAGGLGSNSNYLLSSDCNPLIDLSVTIKVTEDIVWQSSDGPTEGFGFQLNAYAPSGDLSGYQQYLIYLGDTELMGGIDNWGPNGQLINDFFPLTSLPSVTLPAGYALQISLQNDGDGNVTGATYNVFDNQGNTQASVQQDLLSQGGVTPADLAPIVAFELDFVGPINGESAVLSSGAGWIAYKAASPLTVLSQEPPCANSGVVTAETANSFYSWMPAAITSNSFIQYFGVSTAAPMIRKQGKRRPGLIVPRAQTSVKQSPAEEGAPTS